MRLVALAEDPDALRRWLSPHAAKSTAVVSPDRARAVVDLPHGLRGRQSADGDGWDIVHVPLDGPAGALGAALHGLGREIGGAARRTAVVFDAAPPPSPDVLRLVAATPLMPGVDLTPGPWATAEQAWLSGPRGVALVRHGVDDGRSSQELARVVRALALLPDSSPALRWVELVDDRPFAATAEAWGEILRAGYVEVAVRALVGGSPSSVM